MTTNASNAKIETINLGALANVQGGEGVADWVGNAVDEVKEWGQDTANTLNENPIHVGPLGEFSIEGPVPYPHANNDGRGYR